MGGLRLSASAVMPEGLIPMTLWSYIDTGDGWGDDTHAAVWALSRVPGQDPVRLSQFHNSGAGNGDDVADAVTNPSENKIVYCITPLGAGASKLMYAPFPLVRGTIGDYSSVPGSGILDTQPSTLVTSMHPHWCPNDDDLVVYRTLDDSPNESQIKKVVPSTATVTSLKTISRSLGNVYFPRYNYNGTRIAYFLGSDLWVMNADGTGATQVVTGIGATPQGGLDYAWSPVADELVYSKVLTSTQEIRRIQGDGTGDTLLYSDSIKWWALTLYPWAPDGSAVYYFRRTESVDPKFTLWVVDASAGGATQISPTRYSYGGGNDDLAYVFGNRVYWRVVDFTGNDYGTIVSCALDGSDLRTEITFPLTTDLPPLEPERFVGGFYYWLNQPS